MSKTPREIGTLIVVVLKANHLPNKRHIGKQDPYCVVAVNGEKRRTKAIKRGGQHPEWDEEIRFTLFEDVSDPSDRTVNGDKTPPPPPPKDDKGPRSIKGGKIMKLSCFADDPREPDLIGETDVDLTEVLTRGETDEWFTLMNKDKFSGKVYLELTFWSNAPPPEKKVTPKPTKSKQYGGPGSFVPSGELPYNQTNGGPHPSRTVSTGSLYDHSRHGSDTIPASLRASSSLAKLDLYVPPYEQNSRASPIDQVANEFREFGVSDDNRRRESIPPLHTPRPPSASGHSTLPSHQSHRYDQSISEAASAYSYSQSQDQSHHQRALPSGMQYTTHPPYQSPYDTLPSPYHQPSIRGPRHSIPTSSSGFIPLPNPSGFVPFPSHPSDPGTIGNPPTMAYNPSQFHHQPVYASQTPTPTNTDAYLPPSSSFPSQQSFPQSQSVQYPQYAPPPPASTAPQPYTAQGQPLSQPVSSQTYQGYGSIPALSLDSIAHPPLTQSTLHSSNYSISSRPLPPQPQVIYTPQQGPLSYSVSPGGGSQPQNNSYSPTQSGSSTFSTGNLYQPPPPPPPPPIQYPISQPSQHLYHSNGQPTPTGPPPPPPPPSIPNTSRRRRSSLPQPPIAYQQLVYQPPLPPPPPPEVFNQPPPPPPPSHISSYHSSPLPNPPILNNAQEQWISPPPIQTGPAQQGYT